MGTLQCEVAEEGCIQWLFDGSNTAAQTPSWVSIMFDGEGEACDIVSCEILTGVQGPGRAGGETVTTSWGSVKQLLR